ncbi:MAG: hypothetical protein ACRDSL_23700 [Pseudonocardiaceae bacterium]
MALEDLPRLLGHHYGAGRAAIMSLVVALRTIGDAPRPVHLATLPAPAPLRTLTTLCGALFTGEQVETVPPGTGMPCTMCLIHRTATEEPIPPAETAPGGPMIWTRRATPPGYAALGWPVVVRGDQVLLSVGTDLVALVMPTTLAEQAADLLASRERPAPILAHPHAPEHRIVLAAEPYGIELPWPAEIRATTGHLPLPPTVTPSGPVTWAHLPDGHALTFCREIDLFAAIRTLTQTSQSPGTTVALSLWVSSNHRQRYCG